MMYEQSHKIKTLVFKVVNCPALLTMIIQSVHTYDNNNVLHSLVADL